MFEKLVHCTEPAVILDVDGEICRLLLSLITCMTPSIPGPPIPTGPP